MTAIVFIVGGVCLIAGAVGGFMLGARTPIQAAAKTLGDTYTDGLYAGTDSALREAARLAPEPYAGAILGLRASMAKTRPDRGAA